MQDSQSSQEAPRQQGQSSAQRSASQGGSDNVVMRILCYFGPLCLIPYLAIKDSEFIQFHAKQGVVLLIAQVITFVLGIVPLLGWILAPILNLIWIVLAIMGIINAIGGKRIKLPIIGGFAKNL